MSEANDLRPYFVYRQYNDQEELLYIGMARLLYARLGAHEACSHWWDEIASVTAMEYGSKAHAIAAEVEAIKTEKPRYNGQHVPRSLRHKKPREVVLRRPAWTLLHGEIRQVGRPKKGEGVVDVWPIKTIVVKNAPGHGHPEDWGD